MPQLLGIKELLYEMLRLPIPMVATDGAGQKDAPKGSTVRLQPAPPADKGALLRRVTYDLIGLPPTPDYLA